MKNNMLRQFISLLILFCLPAMAQAEDLIADKSFGEANEIIVSFSKAVDKDAVSNLANYTVYEEPDPDIRLQLKSITVSGDLKSASLIFSEPLNTGQPHVVAIANLTPADKALATFTVAKPYLGYRLRLWF